MQTSSALTSLLNLGSAPTTAPGEAGYSLLTQEGNAFQQMMLMLESGAGTVPNGAQLHVSQGCVGQFMPAGACVALSAQGLDFGEKLKSIDQNVSITPAQAALMLQMLSQQGARQGMGQQAQGQGQRQEALSAVQQALEQTVQNNTPTSVEDILAVLPQEQIPATTGVLAGLLQAVKKVVARGEPKPDTEQNPVDPQMPIASVANAFFRPDDAADTTGTSAAAQEGEKTEKLSVDSLAADDTTTIVVPLAYTMDMLPPVIAQGNSQLAAAVVPVEEQALTAPVTMDDLIPPLTTPAAPEAAQSGELPTLSLPVVPGMVNGQVNAESGNGRKLQADVEALGEAALPVGEASATIGATPLAGPHHAAGQFAKTLDLVQTPGFVNHAPVKEQVHVAISQAAREGTDNITIQLEPLELGRIEVKMVSGTDGQMRISFLVDKPETFDSLSRDARYLERSLQEAGIKADTGGMQFNLRQQPQPQMQSNLGGQGQRQNQPQEDDSESPKGGVMAISASVAATRNYLINVRDGVDISA